MLLLGDIDMGCCPAFIFYIIVGNNRYELVVFEQIRRYLNGRLRVLHSHNCSLPGQNKYWQSRITAQMQLSRPILSNQRRHLAGKSVA